MFQTVILLYAVVKRLAAGSDLSLSLFHRITISTRKCFSFPLNISLRVLRQRDRTWLSIASSITGGSLLFVATARPPSLLPFFSSIPRERGGRKNSEKTTRKGPRLDRETALLLELLRDEEPRRAKRENRARRGRDEQPSRKRGGTVENWTRTASAGRFLKSRSTRETEKQKGERKRKGKKEKEKEKKRKETTEESGEYVWRRLHRAAEMARWCARVLKTVDLKTKNRYDNATVCNVERTKVELQNDRSIKIKLRVCRRFDTNYVTLQKGLVVWWCWREGTARVK